MLGPLRPARAVLMATVRQRSYQLIVRGLGA
jgi:hypothetical protein